MTVRHHLRQLRLRSGPWRRCAADPHRVGGVRQPRSQRLRQELKYPIVIDGRNLYDPEVMAAHGFTYYSVGRAAAHPDGVPPRATAEERQESMSRQRARSSPAAPVFSDRISATPARRRLECGRRRQPAHRPPRQPRPSAQRTALRICRERHLRAVRRGQGRLRLPLRQPGQSRSTTRNHGIATLKVGSLGTFHALEVAHKYGAKYLRVLHLGVLRRSAGASAKGNLLGHT